MTTQKIDDATDTTKKMSEPNKANILTALKTYTGCRVLVLRVEDKNTTHLVVNYKHDSLTDVDLKFYSISIGEVLNANSIPDIRSGMAEFARGRIVCLEAEAYKKMKEIVATSQNPCPSTRPVYSSTADGKDFDFEVI